MIALVSVGCRSYVPKSLALSHWKLARRMVQGVPIVDGCLVNTNPATGQVISRVPCTSPQELHGLVEAAKEAQTAWSQQTSMERRLQLLREGMTALSEKQDALADMIVAEMGKPREQAVEEVEGCIEKKDEYLTLLEQSLQPQKHGAHSVVVRQPLGVVAVLPPWNFPADEILLLTLPALGSGNTVVLKPSEVTPETGRMVFEVLNSVLPNGVLQLAQGDGSVGAPLVAHPDIAMVAMTGSSATGKAILRTAAPDMKRLVLELGGKDPMVVFADADIEKAAQDAVEYSLSNTGQVCCSIERIYVDESIYDDFSKRVVQHAETYKVGNGMDPSVKVGPMVSALQRDKVQAQVNDAIHKGAKLLYESKSVTATSSGDGSFYPVTVLSNVSEGMDMYREETFGPVVSLTQFDGSEEAAIRLANDTEYGLAACVYSQDTDKAQRVATAIDAGQVGVNCYALDNMDVACPWVGHKSSGFGYHSGQEGFHNFSIPKTFIYNSSQDDS